jgi:hypothetical protein
MKSSEVDVIPNGEIASKTIANNDAVAISPK